jgi:hypothetical protein
MTKADHFRSRIEFSTIRAELACSADLQETWLHIRESYQHLLYLETEVIPEQTFDLFSRAPMPMPHRPDAWRETGILTPSFRGDAKHRARNP